MERFARRRFGVYPGKSAGSGSSRFVTPVVAMFALVLVGFIVRYQNEFALFQSRVRYQNEFALRRPLRDFAGRQVLLVFSQTGCGPCQTILPELNRVQADEDLQVVVVNHGEAGPTREWAAAAGARFPVLIQEKYQVSRSFQVYATPFAFLIDAAGVVRSKGIGNSRQQIGFVLAHADGTLESGHAEPEPAGASVP
jgi:thiol-disulfide isomerase/thioredoxin